MSLIELYEYLQVMFALYLIVLIVKNKYPTNIIILFIFASFLFLGLKLGLIPYELGGLLDRFLWGTLNILEFTCIAYVVTHNKII